MDTNTQEKLSDRELGLDAKGLRRLRLEGFSAAAAAMNNSLWAIGTRKVALRIANTANRVSNLRRDLHDESIRKARGEPNHLDRVRAELSQQTAELAALEAAAKSLQGPLVQQTRSANTLVRTIEDFAKECFEQDGGAIDESLVDSRYQDQLLSLAIRIKDCSELQSREYAILRASIPEKK